MNGTVRYKFTVCASSMLLSGNPTLIWKLVLGVDANQGWLVSIVDRLPAWDLERATASAAACFDNQIDWLEEPSWIPEFREGIIDPVIPDKDGMLQPPARPGLGFEIRKDWLRKYGKRFFKINETRLKLKGIREKGLKAALDLKKRKERQGTGALIK